MRRMMNGLNLWGIKGDNMSDAKKLIENKEKYDNRFERKIQDELDDDFGLGDLKGDVYDIEPGALEERESVPDWLAQENKEKEEDLKSSWEDIKYNFEWLFERGYINPRNYGAIKDGIEWIDDAFSQENPYDRYRTMDSRIDSFLETLEIRDLEIERDKKQRARNIKRLEEEKKEFQSEKEYNERMRKSEEQRREDGGSRKSVDVSSHTRKTKNGRPIKVKHHKRSKPNRGDG